TKLAYMVRQPIGIVGRITPWNLPLSMTASKHSSALAGSNMVVLKPVKQVTLGI
ncbi:hypothetical protein BGZ61DRAFT_358809, partial [Ilyonectria robusta]|uniref:uncharacterized protein n=1 Tax=Ilyonectria robusta TaxID=1079257 RepID=UPI001E8CFCF6